MKTLEWVLENYNNLETCIDSRLGRRVCQFLTEDQMASIGFKSEEESHEVLEWTEENILRQLRNDVEFGIEKATNHRGISSSLMFEVCKGWCTILENGLDKLDYGYYGHNLFKAIDEMYNFGLVDEDTFDEYFFKQW